LHARTITSTAGILEILHKPYHLHLLDIRGLELNVPPDRPWHQAKEETARSKFYFDEIRADGGVLRKLSTDRNTSPLEFQFPRDRLYTANVHSDVRFATEVRIPKPPGLVRAQGQFGPWDIVHIGEIQASGYYELSHADLSVFHPVLGTLDSKGEFRGKLSGRSHFTRITVRPSTAQPVTRESSRSKPGS
jgi:hypothetical protein